MCIAMLIFTAKISRRKIGLAALVLIVLISAAVFLAPRGERSEVPTAADNPARVLYLESFGWDILPEPIETLSVTLPPELAEPYLSYNELQKEQGFDLEDYCGKTLSRYTYLVTNYPGQESSCQADLYLCGVEIVAGDIICTGENGRLAPLAFPVQ